MFQNKRRVRGMVWMLWGGFVFGLAIICSMIIWTDFNQKPKKIEQPDPEDISVAIVTKLLEETEQPPDENAQPSSTPPPTEEKENHGIMDAPPVHTRLAERVSKDKKFVPSAEPQVEPEKPQEPPQYRIFDQHRSRKERALKAARAPIEVRREMLRPPIRDERGLLGE